MQIMKAVRGSVEWQKKVKRRDLPDRTDSSPIGNSKIKDNLPIHVAIFRVSREDKAVLYKPLAL